MSRAQLVFSAACVAALAATVAGAVTGAWLLAYVGAALALVLAGVGLSYTGRTKAAQFPIVAGAVLSGAAVIHVGPAGIAVAALVGAGFISVRVLSGLFGAPKRTLSGASISALRMIAEVDVDTTSLVAGFAQVASPGLTHLVGAVGGQVRSVADLEANADYQDVVSRVRTARQLLGSTDVATEFVVICEDSPSFGPVTTSAGIVASGTAQVRKALRIAEPSKVTGGGRSATRTKARPKAKPKVVHKGRVTHRST